MRTSLIEIQQIEAHLQQTAEPGEALLFDARMILHPELREKVFLQQETLALVKSYSRQQLKAEVAAAGNQLFTKPEYHSFRQQIRAIFFRK